MHRPNLDCLWVRDQLEDLAAPFRQKFARQVLPRIEAELKLIEQHFRPVVQAFRRTSASLENAEIPPDAAPTLRPALRIKHAAATLGHWFAIGLDLLVGLGISRLAFRLSWGWSIAIGLLFVALAVLSRVAASIFLDRSRPARFVGIAIRGVGIGWLVILVCFLALYLVRNGVLDIGLLGVATPLLWLGFLAQSVGFGVLVEAFGYPVRLFEEYQRLLARRAELDSLRALLIAETAPGGRTKRVRRSAQSNDTPVRPNAGSRNGRSRVAAALALIALAWLPLLHGGPVMAAANGSPIVRVVLAPDESPDEEVTAEYSRIRQLLAGSVDHIVGALGHVEEIQVLRWSDTESVWSAGRVFALPRDRLDLPAEAGIAPFAHALAVREAKAAAGRRAACAGVVEHVRQELLSPPARDATQSCTTQLLARAAEAPHGQLWIVVTDLRDVRCHTPQEIEAKGASILVVAIPQREGPATRERLEERMARVRALFPQAEVLPSWQVDGGSSLDAAITRAVAGAPKEAHR